MHITTTKTELLLLPSQQKRPCDVQKLSLFPKKFCLGIKKINRTKQKKKVVFFFKRTHFFVFFPSYSRECVCNKTKQKNFKNETKTNNQNMLNWTWVFFSSSSSSPRFFFYLSVFSLLLSLLSFSPIPRLYMQYVML